MKITVAQLERALKAEGVTWSAVRSRAPVDYLWTACGQKGAGLWQACAPLVNRLTW